MADGRLCDPLHVARKFEELLQGIQMPDCERRPRVGEPMRRVRLTSETGASLDWERALAGAPLLLVFFRGFW